MITNAGVPHVIREARRYSNGKQMILLNDQGRRLADAIICFGSYGYTKGLLEIMGALTEREEKESTGVLGFLTAEEVFKRFKYCSEHNTSIYVEED